MMVPVSMCGYPNTFHKQISFTWPDLISSVMVYSCADFTGWIQVVMCKLCSTYKNDILASLLLSHQIRAVPAVSGIHSGLISVVITLYITEYIGSWNKIYIYLIVSFDLIWFHNQSQHEISHSGSAVLNFKSSFQSSWYTSYANDFLNHT